MTNTNKHLRCNIKKTPHLHESLQSLPLYNFFSATILWEIHPFAIATHWKSTTNLFDTVWDQSLSQYPLKASLYLNQHIWHVRIAKNLERTKALCTMYLHRRELWEGCMPMSKLQCRDAKWPYISSAKHSMPIVNMRDSQSTLLSGCHCPYHTAWTQQEKGETEVSLECLAIFVSLLHAYN